MNDRNFKFDAELWLHEGEGGWHFITLPDDLVDEVRDASVEGRRPFGSTRVQARIGASSWSTSIFFDRKRGSYLLPVKASIRDAENLLAGDRLPVELTVM